MLFRMIKKFINIPYYFNFMFFFLNERYSKLENDYSRFLKFVFINLFYEGLIKYIIYCIESAIFLIYVQIQATNIVLRFVFIKCVINSIFFVWDCYNEEYRYLLFEIVYMFVFLYTDIKFPIIKFWYKAKNYYKYLSTTKCYSEYNISKGKLLFINNKKFKLFYINEQEYIFYKERFNLFPLPDLQFYYPMFFYYDFEAELRPYDIRKSILICRDRIYSKGIEEPEIFEMTDKEYENYKNNLDKFTAPDLQIYYPMRFALSSVMIRLTGVILSITLLLILFFNFINLFVLVDLNFCDLRKFITYRLTELFVPYESFYNTYFKGGYSDSDYFTDTNEIKDHQINTIYSRFKYWFVLFWFIIQNANINITINLYENLDLVNFISTRSFYFNFFYNFLSLAFIYTLPVHFYYVFNHSYNLISIIKNLINVILNFVKKILGFFFRISKIGAIKSWKMYKVIKDAEDIPVQYQQTKIVDKINKEEMTVKEYFKKQEEVYIQRFQENNNK